MAILEAKGGRLLRNGNIRWRRVVRDVVSGGATAVRQRDPIDFHVTDLETSDVLEGQIFSADVDIEFLDGGGDFEWDADTVTIELGTVAVFVIDHTAPFNLSPGSLRLVTDGTMITESVKTGFYSTVALPSVGASLPVSFALPNEVEFDYDLGDFDGHELDVNLGFSGNGEAEVELSDGPIPTVSEWGMIVLMLVMLSVGTILFGFRRRVVSVDGTVTLDGARATFVPTVFTKVLALTLAGTVVALGGAMLRFGLLKAVDIAGAFVSALVLAYLIHLWVLLKRQ